MSFDATWELDFWGRFRRNIQSADASLLAAIADYDDVLVTLVAEVGLTYVEIRTLERRIEMARANIEIQRQMLELVESLHRNGKVTQLDVAESRSLLTLTQSSVPDLESSLRTAKLSLCVLLARTPSELEHELAGGSGIPSAPPQVVIGVPADLSTANAKLAQARASLGEPGDANVRVREALVQLEEARLKLSWTSMNAPFDGYITNLDVQEGAFGFPGIPIVAFVDSSSFRVDGYFQETKLKHIKRGDHAIITLMSHPDVELNGVVDSIGYAVNPPDIADTEGASYLVPQVEPTFDWVRLPQRVPVRIRLEDVPENIQLVSGTTASVAIRP